LPIDELVREFLYEYRRVIDKGDGYYRKYMRIAEMTEEGYLEIAIPITTVAIKDPKFFSNNLDGRKEMDRINNLSPLDRDTHVKTICVEAYRGLRIMGDKREELRRRKEGAPKSINTDV
jgi:glutamine synthetase type III